MTLKVESTVQRGGSGRNGNEAEADAASDAVAR